MAANHATIFLEMIEHEMSDTKHNTNKISPMTDMLLRQATLNRTTASRPCVSF